MPKFLITFLLLFFFSTEVFADQVVMENGDRLTGKIVKKDGDSVIIQTAAAGTVKIKWSAVAEIVSDEPLILTLDDGKVVQGKLETDQDKIKVEIEESENMTVDKKAVKVVRTIEEQKKYEIEQRRIEVSKLTDFWSGTVDVGFSMTSGNADTRTFTAGLRGVRETRNNKFTVYANALQIKDTSNNNRRFTAQSVWSGARYDVDLESQIVRFRVGRF